MPAITVDPNELHQKAKSLEGLADEYEALRSRLMNTATSMGSAYESADSRSYVARVTELCEQMREVSNRLNNAAQILATQASGYDTTQSENTIAANQLGTY